MERRLYRKQSKNFSVPAGLCSEGKFNQVRPLRNGGAVLGLSGLRAGRHSQTKIGGFEEVAGGCAETFGVQRQNGRGEEGVNRRIGRIKKMKKGRNFFGKVTITKRRTI